MHPVLGQGLNVGLEDAMLFVQCLERHGSNVDTALPAFNTERTPDIHAILTINEAVASGMGIASQVNVAHSASSSDTFCSCAFYLQLARTMSHSSSQLPHAAAQICQACGLYCFFLFYFAWRHYMAAGVCMKGQVCSNRMIGFCIYTKCILKSAQDKHQHCKFMFLLNLTGPCCSYCASTKHVEVL